MTKFKKLDKQKEKGLLKVRENNIKVNKHGHLVIKKTCPNCNSSHDIMKSNKQEIVCSKCGLKQGVVKNE